MLRSSFVFSALLIVQSCGSVDGEVKEALLSAESDVGDTSTWQTGPAGSAEPSSGNDSQGGHAVSETLCLTNCDNGRWKDLVPELMVIEIPAQFSNCTIERATTAPRAPNIEIIAGVNCSGARSIYVWGINSLGSVVTQPALQGQCAAGRVFGRLRRSVAPLGGMSVWSCESSSYVSYSGRVEDASGKQTAVFNLPEQYISGAANIEVAFNSTSSIWGVALSGQLFRIGRNGLMGGSTTWDKTYNFKVQSLTVREGIFQIMEGEDKYTASKCSRVSSGGTLLCNANVVAVGADSVAPVEGSKQVLIQEDYRVNLGVDSEASCVPSGIFQTATRHNDHHGLMLARQISGKNYVAAVVSDSSTNSNRYDVLALNIYNASSGLAHVSTMPLSDISEWNPYFLNLFELGENIYVSFFGTHGLKIARLSTVSLP